MRPLVSSLLLWALLAAPPALAAPVAGEADYRAGLRAEAGDGVPLDERAAGAAFQRAALAGHAVAARRRGLRALRSLDLPAGALPAYPWGGFGRSVEGCGAGSWEGPRVEPDAPVLPPGDPISRMERNERAAAKWFRLAAQRGDRPAMRLLARTLMQGHAQGRDEALRWLRRAAAGGDVEAMALLAGALERFGGPEGEARGWRARAAAAGHEGALEKLLQNEQPGRPGAEPGPDANPEALYLAAVATLASLGPQPFTAGTTTVVQWSSTRVLKPRACAWLVQAAAAGHKAAAFRLTDRRWLDVDPADHRPFLTNAAEAGLVGAQTTLGLDLLLGRDGPADPVAARRWLTRASASPLEAGAEARLWLGRLTKYGTGGFAPDLPAALALLRAAAEDGQAAASAQLTTFKTGPDGRLRVSDPAAVLTARTAAAQAGDAEAAADVGAAWLAGRSTYPDEDQARTWLRRAAEAGAARAQFQLVDLTTDAESRDWLVRAAAQGLPAAVRRLARRLQDEDPPRALQWWARLAARGDAAALRRVAEAQTDGVGLPRDARAARATWRRAAEAGEFYAWHFLALLLAAGEGGPVDAEGALAAWARGRAAGDRTGEVPAVVFMLGLPDARTRLPEARRRLQAMAEHMDRGAVWRLGLLLADGTLMPPDPAAERALYERSGALTTAYGHVPEALVMTPGRALASGEVRARLCRRIMGLAIADGDPDLAVKAATRSQDPAIALEGSRLLAGDAAMVARMRSVGRWLLASEVDMALSPLSSHDALGNRGDAALARAAAMGHPWASPARERLAARRAEPVSDVDPSYHADPERAVPPGPWDAALDAVGAPVSAEVEAAWTELVAIGLRARYDAVYQGPAAAGALLDEALQAELRGDRVGAHVAYNLAGACGHLAGPRGVARLAKGLTAAEREAAEAQATARWAQLQPAIP